MLLPAVYWQRGPIYASLAQTLPFALLYLVQILQTQIIFNGLMLRNLLKRHPWLAAITVATIQGLSTGLEFLRVQPRDGFVQLLILISASTAATAFLYAALRIRTGLLWPFILIDLVSSTIHYMMLPPNPSPYPLTHTASHTIQHHTLRAAGGRGSTGTRAVCPAPRKHQLGCPTVRASYSNAP